MDAFIVPLTEEQQAILLPVLLSVQKGGAVLAQVYYDGLRVSVLSPATAQAISAIAGTPGDIGMHTSAHAVQAAERRHRGH